MRAILFLSLFFSLNSFAKGPTTGVLCGQTEDGNYYLAEYEYHLDANRNVTKFEIKDDRYLCDHFYVDISKFEFAMLAERILKEKKYGVGLAKNTVLMLRDKFHAEVATRKYKKTRAKQCAERALNYNFKDNITNDP